MDEMLNAQPIYHTTDCFLFIRTERLIQQQRIRKSGGDYLVTGDIQFRTQITFLQFGGNQADFLRTPTGVS